MPVLNQNLLKCLNYQKFSGIVLVQISTPYFHQRSICLLFYPVVDVLHSTSVNALNPVMDKVFLMFGIPCIVNTDHGHLFNSDQISKFTIYLGFQHWKITPLWPQANAAVELFMRTLRKDIHLSGTQDLPLRQYLYIFLWVLLCTSQHYRDITHWIDVSMQDVH